MYDSPVAATEVSLLPPPADKIAFRSNREPVCGVPARIRSRFFSPTRVFFRRRSTLRPTTEQSWKNGARLAPSNLRITSVTPATLTSTTRTSPIQPWGPSTTWVLLPMTTSENAQLRWVAAAAATTATAAPAEATAVGST